MIKRSLTSFLDGLVGQVVGWFDQLTCLNAHKSHTCVKSFYLESPYQVSSKSVVKWQSYTHFSLLGWQAGWVVGWFDRINNVHMLSSSIQKLHTKFQPNWLKNAKVMHVFHFQAGRLVGWQAGLAGQHAKIFTNHIHTLSLSIQRLHTKFQPNRL